MKLQDKIKRRLDFYKDLIRERNKIKDLYFSFNKATRKEFCSMLKYNLIRSFKPSFLSKERGQNYNFYNSTNSSFIFKNYIFESLKLKQNFQKIPFLTLTQGVSILIEDILITKVYEDDKVKVEPGDTVLDCGANIGTFSIYAAQKGKMVYAFEPSKANVVSLYENKKLNNCNNIKIIPKAVLNTTKNAKLILGGIGGHFLVSKENENKNAIDIKTISIDEFVKEEKLERVDFIKMDIEGSEEKALLGGEETLRKFKPKLAITIYHKFNDFYQLPLLIKRLNPNYKIKIRNKRGTLMTYAI